MSTKWQADAPSNIALIKYMGKKDAALNIPTNASLSLTLPHLRSFVELEVNEEPYDLWQPLTYLDYAPLKLSEPQQQRFIEHLQLIKEHLSFNGNFIVRSGNNFPSAAGLASSASSFAALTQCACLAISDLTDKEPLNIYQKAQLSQRGSGSSCRSFMYPWTLWTPENIQEVHFPITDLSHLSVLIDTSEKKISSTQAQQMVKTSPHFKERPKRAEQRLAQLLHVLNDQNWQEAYQIVKEEFLDMHQLFHTSKKPFQYINEQSVEIIDLIETYWTESKDGPLITMDAGPNVHLIFRSDQNSIKHKLQKELNSRGYDVI